MDKLAPLMNWTMRPTMEGFVGCISNMTFNRKLYNLGKFHPFHEQNFGKGELVWIILLPMQFFSLSLFFPDFKNPCTDRPSTTFALPVDPRLRTPALQSSLSVIRDLPSYFINQTLTYSYVLLALDLDVHTPYNPSITVRQICSSLTDTEILQNPIS